MVKVLWADDEIDLLRAHIIFLGKRGYTVTPVNSGEEALARMERESFDIVLLDEMMEGMDGLTVLEKIKEMDVRTPIIMITKSEEERLMEDALGARIDDYLTKPVNPSQIVSAMKRILESRRIREKHIPERYARQAAQNRAALQEGMNHEEWARAYERLVLWDQEIDTYPDPGLRQVHADQKREFNVEFAKFIRTNYPRWLSGEDPPVLSPDIIPRYLVDELSKKDAHTAFIVLDCFRLDFWLTIEPLLEDDFRIERHLYYSILPTATPYSRNAIFAGTYPDEIFRCYPDIASIAKNGEGGMNPYEPELLMEQLTRLNVKIDRPPKFVKILSTEDSERVLRKLPGFARTGLMAMVFNFVDVLSHYRGESEILQEIAPDEAAFRSLTRSWFTHSHLREILKQFARAGTTVIITSDHGSIQCRRATLAAGDRDTSANVRYKHGKNIRCNPDDAIHVGNPADFRLPSFGIGTNFIIATGDYFFVYQKNYHRYEDLLEGSFQHGGVSLEEMILPVAILRPQ